MNQSCIGSGEGKPSVLPPETPLDGVRRLLGSGS